MYISILLFLIDYCTRGDVRLTGSLYDTVGQVEICINGTSWGTICSDQWKDTDTSVVCRHLGYTPYGTHNTERNNQYFI